MGMVTRNRFSSFGRYASFLLAAGLLARRVVEIDQRRRCTAWRAGRRSSVATSNNDGCRHLAILVPMYQEQEITADTVSYWHMMVQRAEIDEVVFVTTRKEDGIGEPTTRAMLTRALAQANERRLKIVHCTTIARFRAAQLNLAVGDIRDRCCDSESGTAGVWIGVYNADSRPEASSFRELRQRALSSTNTRAFQQLVDYVLPNRAEVSWLAAGNAVLQTWWTRTHYWARNTRGSRSRHWRASSSPFSTFGHGEFIRLDLLDEIGGFPDFAYADGLLLGWILRLMDEPIGLLACADRAEVPRSARHLLTQQRAWMQGLLGFGDTVRWARENNRLRLAGPAVAALRCQHMSIPIAWGLSTPAVAAGAARVIGRWSCGEANWADAACLLGLVSYPVIPALASAAQDGEAPGLMRLVATAASWMVEGLAFWPALLSRLRKSQAPPAKTPR